jgi:hypothetical protein
MCSVTQQLATWRIPYIGYGLTCFQHICNSFYAKIHSRFSLHCTWKVGCLLMWFSTRKPSHARSGSCKSKVDPAEEINFHSASLSKIFIPGNFWKRIFFYSDVILAEYRYSLSRGCTVVLILYCPFWRNYQCIYDDVSWKYPWITVNNEQ